MFIMLITEMRDKILPRKHRFCNDISDLQAHVSAERGGPCTRNWRGGGTASESHFFGRFPVRHVPAPSACSQSPPNFKYLQL